MDAQSQGNLTEGKAQYSVPPFTNLFRSSVFDTADCHFVQEPTLE